MQQRTQAQKWWKKDEKRTIQWPIEAGPADGGGNDRWPVPNGAASWCTCGGSSGLHRRRRSPVIGRWLCDDRAQLFDSVCRRRSWPSSSCFSLFGLCRLFVQYTRSRSTQFYITAPFLGHFTLKPSLSRKKLFSRANYRVSRWIHSSFIFPLFCLGNFRKYTPSALHS